MAMGCLCLDKTRRHASERQQSPPRGAWGTDNLWRAPLLPGPYSRRHDWSIYERLGWEEGGWKGKARQENALPVMQLYVAHLAGMLLTLEGSGLESALAFASYWQQHMGGGGEGRWEGGRPEGSS